jgi:3-keto-disaccharide hydrolase
VVSLFNGRDLAGWKSDVPERDADPSGPPSFVVRDGKLVSLGKPEGLLTDGRYRDYRLELEYRFSGTPGNCGVRIHASKPRGES